MAHVPAPPPWHRALTSVGVTGTNGKSSTTWLVAAALARVARPVVRTSTLGSFLDDERLELPFDYAGFVEAMRRAVEAGGRFAAVELTSEALAQGFARAWPCRFGVFTNLSHDHLDAHRSAEHYLASKAQLFLQLPSDGAAVINGCDPAGQLLAEIVPAGVPVIRYGVTSRGEPHGPLDVGASRIDPTWEGTEVTLVQHTDSRLPPLPERFTTRGIGAIFVENALAALCAAVVAGCPVDDALDALAAAAPPPGRFEVVSRAPYAVVDFAHTPDALRRTLDTARALCRGQLTVVFGAGGHRDADKRPKMGEAAREADHVILTSDNPRDEEPADIARAIAKGLDGHLRVTVELDRRRAIERALLDASADDVVVVAGKGHEATQIIGDQSRRFSDSEAILSALSR